MRGPEPVLEPRYEDLVHRVLDGEASAGETAELHAYLARTPDAHAYFEDLQKLSRALGAIRDVELPAELQRDIVQEAQRLAAASGHRPQPRRRLVFADWRREPLRPRHAAIFGLGMAAGLALFALVFDGVSDSPHVTPGDGAASIGTARSTPLGHEQLEIAGAAVDVRTWAQGDRVTAQVSVPAGSAAEVVLEFDERSLRFLGVGQNPGAIPAQDVSGARIDTEPGRVSLRPDAVGGSDAAYWVSWRRQGEASASLRVTLIAAGQRVERSLHAGSGHR